MSEEKRDGKKTVQPSPDALRFMQGAIRSIQAELNEPHLFEEDGLPVFSETAQRTMELIATEGGSRAEFKCRDDISFSVNCLCFIA